MSTLRTALRIVWGHRLHILIYLVMLSMIGVITGMSVQQPNAAELTTATARVAVIDRDHSAVSEGLTAYLEQVGDPTSVEDSRRAIQDATADGRVEYIVIIPEGYEDQLVRAVESGQAPPTLETVISYSSVAGSLMDERTGTYLGQVADYLKVLTKDPAEAVALAAESMTARSSAELIAPAAAPLPDSFLLFIRFSTYPILVYAVVAISILMSSLRARPVLARTTASPAPSYSRSLGLLAACGVLGLLDWVWIMSLGLNVFTPDDVIGAAPRMAVVALAMLAYTAVAVSIGFLIGQLGLGTQWADAIANIGGMAMSFLAGAWVPLTLLPDAMAAVARLTPGYWAQEAITGAATAESMSREHLAPLLADCGLCLMFAVAITVVAMVVGRTRARAAL